MPIPRCAWGKIGLEFQHAGILGRGLACVAGRDENIRQVLVNLKVVGVLARS